MSMAVRLAGLTEICSECQEILLPSVSQCNPQDVGVHSFLQAQNEGGGQHSGWFGDPYETDLQVFCVLPDKNITLVLSL